MFERDFVPSVPEPTPEERAYALNLLNESLKRNLRSTVEELPPDAQDILWRDDVVMHERAVFERDDTSIIPERILKPGEPLQLGDILNMLSVYFWWNEEQSTPQAYLERLLGDLTDDRFVEATRVLHAEFLDLCTTQEDSKRQCANPDGYACFTGWLRSRKGDAKSRKVLSDPSKRAEQVTYWLYEIDYDDSDLELSDLPMLECDFEVKLPPLPQRPVTLAQTFGKYMVEALTAAGVDLLEAQDALNVLKTETERRESGSMDGYAEFRSPDVSFEVALQTTIPDGIAADPILFEELTEAYDELPDDVLTWDMTRRRALARRYAQENCDLFYLEECTYQLHENGLSPFYRRRFAEEYWPADQRV